MENYKIYTITAAYGLDLILGDPRWPWHPVRLIGKLITFFERKLNFGKHRRLKGLLLVVLIAGIVILSVTTALKLSKAINSYFYYTFYTLLIYFALSIKSLGLESGKVYQALKDNDIEKARKSLSMIVARDTENLDEPQIVRGAVETTAESIMDGISAPLFYAFLGGPILAWIYKTINTLDSMVGYRNDRFRAFGRSAAKLDGLLNVIPSKITCLVIYIASIFYRKNHRNCLQQLLKYFFSGQEANSEAVEAVMAGALEVQLGGLNFYHGVPVQKNLIGENKESLKIKHIKDSIKIAYGSSAVVLVLGIIILYAIR